MDKNLKPGELLLDYNLKSWYVEDNLCFLQDFRSMLCFMQVWLVKFVCKEFGLKLSQAEIYWDKLQILLDLFISTAFYMKLFR